VFGPAAAWETDAEPFSDDDLLALLDGEHAPAR
jgi:hypothetical protein